MIQLIFASRNQNKTKEINNILQHTFPGRIEVKGLESLDYVGDIPETSLTISGNATQKAMFIYDRYHQNCFAEDTGLEITALNGEPGVYSARYAGIQRNDQDNINLVLAKMTGLTERSARFKTVISLVYENTPYLFEGICKGKIALARKGNGGFGYDPIFIPDGYDHSFGEMPSSEKNKISHRNIALQKMIQLFSEKIL
ncbi:MAG: RdgB/HAM1 family non-canonical purine NTP pyrophosphatase [Saprospiraceae bacterium]|nr:RdgB/HAM1 family non-canonical purine NTP pyrophosphatase [Saprospiraceae bacterium]